MAGNRKQREYSEKLADSKPVAMAVPEKAEQRAPAPAQKTTTKSVEPEKIASEKQEVPPPAQKASSTTVAAATSPKPAATPKAEEKKDIVVYRVQILANTKPVGSQSIIICR